uniref:Uncharacterized protein n=1 Tax=Arundo donax TaxID=35708 RepID=A0A0A9FAA4_ARUDO
MQIAMHTNLPHARPSSSSSLRGIKWKETKHFSLTSRNTKKILHKKIEDIN